MSLPNLVTLCYHVNNYSRVHPNTEPTASFWENVACWKRIVDIAQQPKIEEPDISGFEFICERKSFRSRWLGFAIGAFVLVSYAVKSEILEHYVISTFNEQKEWLLSVYSSAPSTVVLVYSFAYILSTALTIPIAIPMTIAGGVLFGFWQGTLIVSLSSTIGATLSFLIVRHFCRDFVCRRFFRQFEIVNQHIEKEGAYYLFTVRLIPIFPFFLMNLLLGLTSMRTRTYFWVSMVGMLAGTMAFVNAGVEFASISSYHDIFSPTLVTSFIAIGIAPLLIKKLSDLAKFRLQKRKMGQGSSS